MKKNYILIVVACILLILVIIKIISNSKKQEKQTVRTAAVKIQAECFLARDTVIEMPLRAVGYIKSNERIDVVSELSRRIISIHFKEGSQVKRGELLFQLDDAEWIAALKKNKAELDLASLTEERDKKLFESGGTSRQVYEEAVSRRKVLQAEGESLQILIEKAKIRAPFNGKTGIRNVSEGALVNPGCILTSLEDISSLEIDFTIPESYANSVKTGDLIVFRIEGNPKEFNAIVEAIDPSISMSTGSLRILAKVNSLTAGIVPGRAVSVNINTKSAIPGLYLPTQALIPTPAGYKVYKVDSGKALLKPIKTGLRSEKMVEVTDGVKAGDSILTTGFMKVRPEARIQIIKTW